MFLIFLGILVFAFTASIARTNPKLEGMGKVGRFAGIALMVLGLSTACFVQISPGEVGVKTLFGKVQEGVLREGLNFVNPLMKVSKFDIRTQNYTMSSIHDEGDKNGDDAIRVLSADGLEVEIDLTVLYSVRPDKAPDILQTIGRGYRDIIVRPVTRTEIRDNAVFYDAVALYSTKREEFQQKVYDAIDSEFEKRGLQLEQVGIRNINLPASVKAAIEGKINAEQEAQKMKFVLDKERQEADRKRVEAQGIADYQRIITSSLTDKLLQYELIKAQKNWLNFQTTRNCGYEWVEKVALQFF
ncbi:MAG: prohibitin family protein [Saprospiraceae bacterium]